MKTRFLSTPRSFFCTATEHNSRGFYAVGGFSGTTIEKSAEFVNSDDWGWGKSGRKVEDMPEPRMGHGCTGLPSDPKILVSGGSEEEGSPALSSSNIFDPSFNGSRGGQWRQTGQMNQERFGHALLTVGDQVLAIGGKKIHPEEITDTIEEYSVTKGDWSYLPIKLIAPRTNFGFTLIPPSMFPGCRVEL